MPVSACRLLNDPVTRRGYSLFVENPRLMAERKGRLDIKDKGARYGPRSCANRSGIALRRDGNKGPGISKVRADGLPNLCNSECLRISGILDPRPRFLQGCAHEGRDIEH
jgi:hypothetical protein